MSQVISDFLALKEPVQCQILKAALAGRSYSPSTTQASATLDDYWSGRLGNVTGTDSMFPFRVRTKGGHEYTIHKDLHTYLNRLFIGFDVALFESTLDKGTDRSLELQEMLREASANGQEDIEIGGVLKCEALARLLRYGRMTVEGPIELDQDNPFKGSLVFRIPKRVSISEQKAESARLLREINVDKAINELVGG